MKPELLQDFRFLEEFEPTPEDRADNRRAVTVVMVAAVVVIAACLTLLFSRFWF